MPPSILESRGPEFALPDYFSILAFFTFGITGALAGLRRGYDVIGVVFLAMVAAGGGGMIRDGLLLSHPPIVLTNTHGMLAVLAATLVTYLFHGLVERLGRLIAIIDALGLGAFAVIGVQQTLQAGQSEAAAIVGGTLSAVGGGLLRDILVREEPLLLKPGQFYALVAIAGSCLFLALLHWSKLTSTDCGLVTIVSVFAVRMLAIRFNWRTSALLRDPPPA